MAETIFLTGATGFLGTELASRLIQRPDTTVYALVRAADDAEADHRLRADWQRMDGAVQRSREILERMGVREKDQFLGTLNAGHPGGMLPLTEKEKDTLHSASLPDNLYVADATLLPQSMGNPPMLTIMALARKMAALL